MTAATRQRNAAPADPRRHRILVVEDEAVISLDLARTLKLLGYSVAAVAQTAQEAVEMALRHRPGLILMDICLAGPRDGIQAAEELRRQLDLPIVFVTAHSDSETIRRAIETDPAGFIVKPFSLTELRLRLEIAFARHALKRRSPLPRPAALQPQQLTYLQLSALAHDFNNMLTLIMASADALRARGDSPEVEQIRRASQLATMLCRQLLPSPGAVPAAPAVELNSVLETNFDLIERAAGIGTTVALIKATEPLFIAGDEGQLSRICINLALNACKAMPDGGELRIETRKVAHSLAQLCISDTGSGMAPAVLQRIFDPFFTGDAAGSSGLGLTIVQGIVSQMGGTISVESEPGAGTSFTILLPLCEPAPPPALPSRFSAQRLPAPSCSRQSVLLVEDQPDIRSMIRQHLELAGFECLSAGDGEQALAELRSRGAPVQLLVTDISLPGGGGVELADECLRLSLCSKVLLMSGSTGLALGQNSLLLSGRAEFMGKPFTASEMTARVAEILRTIRG